MELAAELSDEPGRRCRGPAGSQHIVHDKDSLPCLHGVGMNLQRVRPVLEGVRLPHGLGR